MSFLERVVERFTWLTRSQQGSDPGVKISIYYPPVTNYKVPGPSVFTC